MGNRIDCHAVSEATCLFVIFMLRWFNASAISVTYLHSADIAVTTTYGHTLVLHDIKLGGAITREHVLGKTLARNPGLPKPNAQHVCLACQTNWDLLNVCLCPLTFCRSFPFGKRIDLQPIRK